MICPNCNWRWAPLEVDLGLDVDRTPIYNSNELRECPDCTADPNYPIYSGLGYGMAMEIADGVADIMMGIDNSGKIENLRPFIDEIRAIKEDMSKYRRHWWELWKPTHKPRYNK